MFLPFYLFLETPGAPVLGNVKIFSAPLSDDDLRLTADTGPRADLDLKLSFFSLHFSLGVTFHLNHGLGRDLVAGKPASRRRGISMVS